MNKKQIKQIIFDVLGDFADPKAFEIDMKNKTIMGVYVGFIYAPYEILWEEFNNAKKFYPELKDFTLFLCTTTSY